MPKEEQDLNVLAERALSALTRLIQAPGPWRDKLAALRLLDSEGMLEEFEAWLLG